MTEEELRNYLGVVSFLLAALSFVAGERRDAVAALHERSDVSRSERWLTVISVGGLTLTAAALAVCSWPVVNATKLEIGDVLTRDAALRTAFVIGWVLQIAVALALVPLWARAWRVKTQQ